MKRFLPASSVLTLESLLVPKSGTGFARLDSESIALVGSQHSGDIRARKRIMMGPELWTPMRLGVTFHHSPPDRDRYSE